MSKPYRKPFKFDMNKLVKKTEYKFKNKIKYIHANFAIKQLEEYNKQIIVNSKLQLAEKNYLKMHYILLIEVKILY